MLFSRSACTCMIPESLTLQRSNGSCAIFGALFTLGCFSGLSSSTELVVYSDVDWASCPDMRKSTSGFAVFLGDNLVSWSYKRQQNVSHSSAEAEYRVVASAVAEASWLRQLLQELYVPLRRAILVYCDNISSVYMSSNPTQH